MAAPITDITSLANLVQAVVDRKVRLALTLLPQFRAIADTRPDAQAMPGSSVTFNTVPNLAKAITPLTDGVDPAGVSLANTVQATVTLNRYGNFTVITKTLQEFAFDLNLMGNIANKIAYNQVDTIDTIVETVLSVGTQVIKEISGVTTVGGATIGITATDLIKMRDIDLAVGKMERAGVLPYDGQNFVCYIDPLVANDLKHETGELGWRYPNNYGTGDGMTGLITGELGIFGRVRFVQTPRSSHAATGAAGINVYQTYVIGAEALAEVVAEEFHVVMDGVVVDPLNIKNPIGWTGVAGWGLYRPESLWRIETACAAG